MKPSHKKLLMQLIPLLRESTSIPKLLAECQKQGIHTNSKTLRNVLKNNIGATIPSTGYVLTAEHNLSDLRGYNYYVEPINGLDSSLEVLNT